ncbi:MAG: FAD-binding oxidoreductase [Casimicrobiaceae bacterium]
MTATGIYEQAESWGRQKRVEQRTVSLGNRFAALPEGARSMLPFGNGRSYGDVCLNEGGTLLHTRGLDRFINFDRDRGVLRCEAGVLLAGIIELVQRAGWCLPVTPGTRFVTVGGAIANDVHGKNQHRAGSFGAHVCALELLRSDGERLLCTRQQNPEWFRATVGGMGLTGLITWAEIQLCVQRTAWLDVDTTRFESIEEFVRLSADAEASFEHSVAWFDCLRMGDGRLRGLFRCANPSPMGIPARLPKSAIAVMPFAAPVSPVSLVHPLPLRVFNALYARPWRSHSWRSVEHYDAFLYPLDRIAHWNRIYGPRGFYQFQCVVPDQLALTLLIDRIRAGKEGSCLAVLKGFGDAAPEGFMSFARKGYTLALDFPNRGERTVTLLESLGAIVAETGGAIYPAKDACMSPAEFSRFFPNANHFSQFVDPAFSSMLWRRVRET